jgi:Fic family protein
MEPLHIPVGDTELDDISFDLIQKAAHLSGNLRPEIQNELGRLVRSMNCYYSNFIEGHYTHPRDIERALNQEFSKEAGQRNLQKEAIAHISVQEMIDSGRDESSWPASDIYVRWLHREFCQRLPPELRIVKSRFTGRELEVVPGEYRTEQVDVYRHVPPPPSDLAAFMHRFEEAYSPSHRSKTQLLLSAAEAHHRLLWIHPFLDGNGRVVRLMSHAILLRLGVGNSLWSVSRGLARNVDRYKELLGAADATRRNDLDGRGALSLEAFKSFCRFFVEVCIDQVEFMASLLQPAEILRRIELYVTDEVAARRLPRGSFEMLREAFYQGAVPRGRAPEITGYEERRARETVSVLLERGLLRADGPRAPVSLSFPEQVLERWLPQLYPIDSAPRESRAVR